MDWQTGKKIDDTYHNTKTLIEQIRTVKTQTEWLLTEMMKSTKTLSKLCNMVDDIQPDDKDSF